MTISFWSTPRTLKRDNMLLRITGTAFSLCPCETWKVCLSCPRDGTVQPFRRLVNDELALRPSHSPTLDVSENAAEVGSHERLAEASIVQISTPRDKHGLYPSFQITTKKHTYLFMGD